MKLPCELIRDLLPLYHDGVCNDVSKTLVKEHLNDCTACAQALKAIDAEIEVPKLEADAGKPLKKIKRRWKKWIWLLGLVIGIAVFFLWVWLTQTSNVLVDPAECTVTNVTRFSNGMYYLEYRLPYDFSGMCADCCRSDDGSIHIREYRPILAKKDPEYGVTRDYIIDPEHNTMYTDTGNQVPLTAFYLGCPDQGDAVLVWSAEEEYPQATPEMEEKYLYHVFR